MSDKKTTIKCGEEILLECGEYSDFYTIGLFVATRDINLLEEQDDARSGIKYEGDAQDKFLKKMKETGALVAREIPTIHIGSYGRMEI